MGHIPAGDRESDRRIEKKLVIRRETQSNVFRQSIRSLVSVLCSIPFQPVVWFTMPMSAGDNENMIFLNRIYYFAGKFI